MKLRMFGGYKQSRWLVCILAACMTFLVSSNVWAQDACVKGDNSWALLAGQYIDSGTVSAEVVGSDLAVTYATTNGWELVEAHLWVGTDQADMPSTRKGNPIPGRFPYNSGDITGATTHTFTIPLADLGFSCPSPDAVYFVAAHAAVRKLNPDTGGYDTETGWSDGERIVEKGNWATLSSLTLSCDCGGTDPEDPRTCETAFTYSGTDADICFLDIDEDGDSVGDFNRWGWSVGPLEEDSYNFTLHAGAGQCDRSKGEVVGNVQVNVEGNTVDFTYNMNSGNTMGEVHFYAGCGLLPLDNNGFPTVAPGQYPVVVDGLDENNTTTYSGSITLNESCIGGVYVVAHAVACTLPE